MSGPAPTETERSAPRWALCFPGPRGSSLASLRARCTARMVRRRRSTSASLPLGAVPGTTANRSGYSLRAQHDHATATSLRAFSCDVALVSTQMQWNTGR